MELRHLRYFVAVAEEEHVTRAAERLHMAQQPLSASIRHLESELGFDLFDRIANRIRLTSAGAAFLEEARNLLATADRAVERGRRAARGEIGALRIGFCSAAMERVLPPAIASFRARFPAIALDLRRLDQVSQLGALDRDELDLVFVHRPFDERGRSALDVIEEGLFVALPAAHELAATRVIDARALSTLALIRYGPSCGTAWRTAAEVLFSRLEIAPQYVEEVADRETGFVLVAAGLACSIVPESVASGETRPGIAFVPIDSDVRIRVAAVWNRRADEHLLRRSFVDLISTTENQPPGAPSLAVLS